MRNGSIHLLLVDDVAESREHVAAWFADRGHRVATAASAREALALADRSDFEVGMFDLKSDESSVIDLLRAFREVGFQGEILLLADEGTIETAVEAIKLGAFDYVRKPCRLSEVERRCRKACEIGRLRRASQAVRTPVSSGAGEGGLVGDSPVMREVFRLIERVGRSTKPVLIAGETGTGKELVARAIWHTGPLADRPFITVDCSALPEQLLESELFGHEKGAFTGAAASKPGLFEAADGGTLFVDEIGELAPSLQAKLLRAFENGSFRRVGALKEQRANVRLIAATNRDLAAEVASGRFREDLFYRLDVLSITLPPLRERQGDIPRLIEAFLDGGWELDEAARGALERYSWPGNVRQLRNALERGKAFADGALIHLKDLPASIATAAPVAVPRVKTDDLETLEREHVLAVLDREGGNKARAARILGVDRRGLYRMLERFGVHEARRRTAPMSELPCVKAVARIAR